MRLSRIIATVTAGLKWPPEMCPKAKIAASRPSPNANGTTSRLGVGAEALGIAAMDE